MAASALRTALILSILVVNTPGGGAVQDQANPRWCPFLFLIDELRGSNRVLRQVPDDVGVWVDQPCTQSSSDR